VRKTLPMDHEAYDHLTKCSECYREFRAYQQSIRSSSWRRAAIAAAAVLAVAIVGGTYAVRTARIDGWSSSTQAVLLDYRSESATRSEAGDPVRRPKTLPRKNIAATILTPTGSEPGRYEVRVVNDSGRIRLGQAATGEMENFAVRIRVDLDL